MPRSYNVVQGCTWAGRVTAEVDGGTRRGATTWRDGMVSCGRVAKRESTHIDNQQPKGLHVTRDLTLGADPDTTNSAGLTACAAPNHS